jgi:poly(3-hydroxybutyrate) depolymerase
MTHLAILATLLLCQDKPRTGGPFEVSLDKPASKYWLQVPEEYDAARKVPMAVILHGAGDTAENFIRVWPAATRKYGWITVAVKSRGQVWDDSDGDMILATMDHVRKTYSIDNERVFLIGYSSGGFMACRFGLKNHAQFRVMGALAGAQEA